MRVGARLTLTAMEAVMAGNTRVAIEDGKGNTLIETDTDSMGRLADDLGKKSKGKRKANGKSSGSGKSATPQTAFEQMNGEIVAAFDEWLVIEKEREALNDRVKVLLEPFKSSHEWKPALLKRVFREKRKAMRDSETFAADQMQLDLFADALGIGGGS